MKRVLKWSFGGILGLAAALVLLVIYQFGFGNFNRMVLGVGQSYDLEAPALPASLTEKSVLIFSKTNGYRDDAQIIAANLALEKMARARGWSSFTTENAAVFDPTLLGKFKVVVWNSVSGDVLTATQRSAFKSWLEGGGGVVALHGSGGDPEYAWKWYVDELIGAQFIGHTMEPQFQDARLIVEDADHPATRHLPKIWLRNDEWYSFKPNPRGKGSRILVRVDETSYKPEMKLPFSDAKNIRMGQDHPLVWTHCVGKGRAFYSALGHPLEAYSEPLHLRMIEGAILWAAGEEVADCSAAASGPQPL